jgi:hypothetical protein
VTLGAGDAPTPEWIGMSPPELVDNLEATQHRYLKDA